MLGIRFQMVDHEGDEFKEYGSPKEITVPRENNPRHGGLVVENSRREFDHTAIDVVSNMDRWKTNL